MKLLDPQDIWPERYSHSLDAFSAGLWNINPGGGRFYKPNRPALSTLEKLDLLKTAGAEYIEAHDTDILPLSGIEEYPWQWDETRKMEALRKAAVKFREELDKRDLRCGVFTMNLFNSEACWNFGNFGSEIKEVRELAIDRTIHGLEIAIETLDAQVYVYWVGTNGPDGKLGAFHPLRISLTRDALKAVISTVASKFGDDRVIPFAFEPKPEEPKYKMYYGTTASALACIFRIALEDPDIAKFMGINIEVAHEVMAKMDPAMAYGEALESGKLFHVHENSQLIGPGFDFDGAAGDDDLVGLIDRMWQLDMAGYQGLLGIDVQPLPTDSDKQQAATVARSIKTLEWAVVQARGLDKDTMARLHAAHNQAGIYEYVGTLVFGI